MTEKTGEVRFKGSCSNDCAIWQMHRDIALNKRSILGTAMFGSQKFLDFKVRFYGKSTFLLANQSRHRGR